MSAYNGMTTIYSTPLLQAITSTGKTKYWQGHVSTDGVGHFTFTTYCQNLGKVAPKIESASDLFALEGQSISKITQSAFVTIVGKNIGRRNDSRATGYFRNQLYFQNPEG
jgi:hypothetical protein